MVASRKIFSEVRQSIAAPGTARLGAILAAWINRLAGHYADPTPATQVIEMIHQIPRAMKKVLGRSG